MSEGGAPRGGGRAGRLGRAGAEGHFALGSGAEFDVIRKLLDGWSDAARGIGSDCAVLDVPPHAKLVVSTDTSVEHVHFRSEWLTPSEIGYRAAAAALSDLAAAAAAPLGVLLALSAPDAWRDRLADVGRGVGEAARDGGALVVGGDTTAGPVLALTVTVLGSADRPVTRAGARAGDAVYVTGTLGGPAAAVAAWTRGDAPSPAARARFAHPVPRVREARWLAARGTTSAIDVSDGLVADLGHLAAASGVRLLIDLGRVPRWTGSSPLDAAASGEEYELAVTVAHPLDVAAFTREFGTAATHIGDVVSGPPGVDAHINGVRVDPILGYDHYSR